MSAPSTGDALAAGAAAGADPAAARGDLRAALVGAAHACHAAGLVVAAQGNLSGRDGGAVLISAAGAPLGALTSEDLVTLALGDGAVLAGAREPSSERRVHLAIYRSREEVGAVVHTHSPHATAWSFLAEPLATGSPEIDDPLGGPVETAEQSPAGSQELADAALGALGGRRAVLLPGHGPVGVGRTPAEAFEACLLCERQAQVAWLLRRR